MGARPGHPATPHALPLTRGAGDDADIAPALQKVLRDAGHELGEHAGGAVRRFHGQQAELYRCAPGGHRVIDGPHFLVERKEAPGPLRHYAHDAAIDLTDRIHVVGMKPVHQTPLRVGRVLGDLLHERPVVQRVDGLVVGGAGEPNA